MVRRTMLFGVVLAGLAGAAPAALAQDGGGVVGGAVARLVGGGDNAEVVVERVTAFQPRRLAQPGWGNGTGTTVQYMEPAPAAPARPMALVGGGDNAEVVAVAPAAPATAASALAGARGPGHGG